MCDQPQIYRYILLPLCSPWTYKRYAADKALKQAHFGLQVCPLPAPIKPSPFELYHHYIVWRIANQCRKTPMGVVVGGVHILMAHPLAHKGGTFFWTTKTHQQDTLINNLAWRSTHSCVSFPPFRLCISLTKLSLGIKNAKILHTRTHIGKFTLAPWKVLMGVWATAT